MSNSCPTPVEQSFPPYPAEIATALIGNSLPDSWKYVRDHPPFPPGNALYLVGNFIFNTY
ncbi:hypothetical protein DXB27_07220 [Parabacteroides gordonii]|nr:hypothetical protein DXB27_07220 [Parabacteroides gordonii]